jgi:gliding-associated putative ABC transporter substrate-binding component GldG
MTKKKALNASLLTAAVIGSLVLVNVIGLGVFHRFDLTRDHQFTLSEATRTSLAALKDPITIRAYFTKDLPPPHSTNARFVKDLLEEYYAAGHGKVRYEMIDPTSEETDADKEKKKDISQDIFGRAVREETSVEKELREMGVPPVQVRVNEGDKLEVKRAYMGIVVQYQDKKEVLPLVSDTAGLEYDLTTLIRKVSREKAPKIALIGGHQGPDPDKEMTHFVALLKQLYEVSNIDLTQQPQIPDDIDALLVVGPKTAFSDAEKQVIDKFVTSGRSAAFLLGAVAPDVHTLAANPTQHGLNDLLAGYGVKIGDGLVLDAQCATITVSQQRGFMQIQQPVRYPFFPMPQSLDPKHPLTRGLSQIAFPFMSPLELALPQGSSVKGEVIARSSRESWIQSPPFNLDPFQRWTRDQIKDEGEKGLLVTLQGAIKSHYAPDAPAASSGSSRVLVAGGYAFVLDDMMSKGNEVLSLNLLDWLVQDEALLAVRARGMAAAPIDDKLTDTKRNVAKYANIAGLPLAFIAFGIVRWRLRESRRRKVTL